MVQTKRLGKCSGCDFEGPPSRVLSHHRSCSGFADLYRRDPALALLNPLDVYTVHHHVANSVTESSDPGGSESRPRSSRAAKSAGRIVPSRVPGPVTVEYWTWSPTILEELHLDVDIV